MKYKLGEFVRFVEERREGYITRIIDESTIAVTDDDGFEIPVLASQVTRVHGKSSDQENALENTPNEDTEFVSTGLFIAVIPDKKVGSVVHISLLNTTSYQVLATLVAEKPHKFKGEFNGILKAKSATQVYSASLNELDQWPIFHFQCLLFAAETTELNKPIEFSGKLKAKHFSGAKQSSPYFEHPGWLIQLDSAPLVIDPEKLKESFFKPIAEKQQVTNPGKVVDLHIEKLREHYQFLNSNEMLNIQLDHFRKSLDAAIVHKLSSIVFIHGSGNGTLRNEIYKVVSKHPQVKTFMDAYKERFGYGGTEVFLK